MNKHFLRNIAIGLVIAMMSASLFATPAINAHDIYGKSYHFSIPSKKWVIINYWAAWCQFCVNEIPELNKLAKNVEGTSAIFFAVNYDHASAQEQRAFAAHYQVNYLLLQNNPFQHLLVDNPISTLPTTFIISPDGRVQRLEGQLHPEDVMQYIH